jgi:cytoskeletal protein CcmA (bactofilin family)
MNMPGTNPFSGTLGNGEYDVTITPVSGFSYRWTIESVGSVNIVTRRIRVVVVVRPDVTTAMTISGNLDIKGNAQVNGDVVKNTTPSFEEVFGVTKEEMQDNATYKYTNPPNNKMPVEKITWINNGFEITQDGWVGGGITIVNGDLKITGGTFNGIIWVIGKLSISGNPVINGSIFVEGEVTVDTTITGTAKISFDQSAIDAAFSNSSTVLSWQEF